jgi:formate hydrogenlyase subunit 6/NADH:ubiquinone oxidoreductase subunit I
MKHYIYYFSGTGNSLYIAKELQKLLPDTKLIPVMNEINLNKIEIDVDSIGFVFPVHAFSLPIPVKDFLKKAVFPSSCYTYAIATRGGSPCNVFRDMELLLKKQAVELDAYYFIDMPNNFTHMVETPREDEVMMLNTSVSEKLSTISDVIYNKRKFHDKNHNKSFFRKQILFPVLSVIFHKTGYLHTNKKFYADSKCTGCGLCARLCLINRIDLDGGKPRWNNDSSCIFCFACINYCPAKAIQIRGSKSDTKGRYCNPLITASEISLQKGEISLTNDFQRY